MIQKLLAKFGYLKPSSSLASILANEDLKEEFLGVAAAKMPSPEQIIEDANALSGYATTREYRVFAQEMWARYLNHLDKVFDANTSLEKLQYHRGAASATMDLLRISYQARLTREQLERDKKALEQHQ